METMKSEKITLLQLKEELKELGLSTKGNKSELLGRLYEYVIPLMSTDGWCESFRWSAHQT